MNELDELQIKGELTGKGLLTEKYNSETDNLEHSLTLDGKAVSLEILKDIKWQREFMKMAIEEANKHIDPAVKKAIILEAIQMIQSGRKK